MSDHTIETTELVAGTWAIDPAHSEVAFTVRHLMSKVRGAFGDFSGESPTADGDPA
ncbi:MAG: YceI family protein, partial [Propionibacteriales bacterium]|nr:YceI family protein [Propionibacteriales bacterium]